MRTGVIIGVNEHVTQENVAAIYTRLRDRFPNVVFALVPNANSVAFTFDDEAVHDND